MFDGTIYWLGKYDSHYSLLKTSISNPGNPVKLLPYLGVPSGMDVYHAGRQPAATNACGQNNGGCVHLCLPSPAGYSCRCSDTVRDVNKTFCNQPSQGN